MASLSPTETIVTCSQCQHEGPDEDFVAGVRLKRTCKGCRRAYKAKTFQRYKESGRLKPTDPARQRVANLKFKYRLSEAEQLTLLAAGCGVCGSHKNLQIDHDHSCCDGPRTCGQCVRTALCARCNRTLGGVGDDIDLLMSMVTYLMEHSSE